MRTAYRSVPLNPSFGLYVMRIVPTWGKAPWLGGDTTEAELKELVAPLCSRVTHALPRDDTPVVETVSCCAIWNVKDMIRHSATALDVIIVIAANARIPCISPISSPLGMRGRILRMHNLLLHSIR